VTSKMADHLPLYRLEQIFARQQVNISRSTLCGWMAAAARVVEPLYKLMCDRVRQSDVMHTDDTTVPVQHEGHCRQGRLWTYFGNGCHLSRGAPKPASAGRSKPASVVMLPIPHLFGSMQVSVE